MSSPSSTGASAADSELIRRAAGDTRASQQARAKIVQRYRPLVESVVSKIVPPDEREDAVQLGYLGVLKALENFDPDQGTSFGCYARPYIRGEVLKGVGPDGGYRSRRRPLTPNSESIAAYDESPLDRLKRAAVREFISNLTERQQYVIRRVFREGASQAQVSRELDVSRTTITNVMQRIRERGRRELQAWVPSSN